MATLAKAHGNIVVPSEQLGRDINWISVVSTDAVLNDLVPILEDGNVVDSSFTYADMVRQTLDNFCSITIVGDNTTTEIMFLTEGLGAGGPGETTLQAQVNAIDTALLLVGGEGEDAHLGAVLVTAELLVGLVFTTDVVSA